MKPIREWPPNRHGALALTSARAGRWFALSGLRRSDADDTRLTDCLPLRGVRLDSERRARLAYQPPVKARNGGFAAARPEHGGGRAWRAGTRSGYGRPGGPGFFGGAVAGAARGRGSGCGAYRTLHHAKSTPNEGTDGRIKLSTSIRGGRGGVR